MSICPSPMGRTRQVHLSALRYRVDCEYRLAVNFNVRSYLNIVWCDVVNDEAGTELAQESE